MQYIDYLLYIFWNALGGHLSALGIFFERWALAHFAYARTGKRFALRMLDTNIYVTVYRHNETHTLGKGVVWVGVDPEEAKRQLEKSQNVTVLMFDELHELRYRAVTTGEKDIVQL